MPRGSLARLPLVACLLAACALIAACDRKGAPGSTPPTTGTGTVRVIVSIPPLKGLVTPLLAGLDASVETLIPVGVSEHGYEIPASSLASLARADLVVFVGRGLEPQVTRFLADHPSPTREVVQFASLVDTGDEHDHGHDHDAHPATGDAVPDQHDHSDEHEGHRHDAGSDPHLWLDPHHVRTLVPGVRSAIERLLSRRNELSDPAKARLAEAERATLERVDAVDAAYAATMAGATSRTIVVAHDAYTLLARRYHLTTVAIAGLNASEPTVKDIRVAIAALQEKGATVVFVEPQLSRAAGEKVAQATGATVLVLDPVGGDDWFATMSANLDALAKGLNVPRR